MAKPNNDPRVLQTRAYVRQAFNELFLEREYEALKTQTIIHRAGVGRSTFYENFRSKDEVLLHALTPILSVLADAVLDGDTHAQILAIVNHVYDRREMALGMLSSPTKALLVQELAKWIEPRLSKQMAQRESKIPVPISIASRQLAASQIELLSVWLEEPSACSPTDLAQMLIQTSRLSP